MMEFTIFEAATLASGSMVAGILLLIKGGDWTIDSAIHVARKWGISPMVVGFTIIAFGTSLPELIVSVMAHMKGSTGIAIGNVLGSNIANVLMVIGITGVFVTLHAPARHIVRDLMVMMGASVVLLILLMQGTVSSLIGMLMFGTLLAYIFYQYKTTGPEEAQELLDVEAEAEEDIEEQLPFNLKYEWMVYGVLVLGLLAIALGAEFLVRGAQVSAGMLNIPEAIVALSIIAFGTSLPELTTSIIASRRGHSALVLGNIIGSNVFNILMIIGITAMIRPIEVGSFAPQLAQFDVWLMLAVNLTFTLLLIFYKKINRNIGFIFVGAYVMYNISLYATHM